MNVHATGVFLLGLRTYGCSYHHPTSMYDTFRDTACFCSAHACDITQRSVNRNGVVILAPHTYVLYQKMIPARLHNIRLYYYRGT